MIEPPSPWQYRIGKKIEQFSHDVFDAFRWMTFVGLTRYVSVKTGSTFALVISYGLSAMLMAFLFAVFMLRGNIVMFSGPGRRAQIANLALNILICTSVFVASLWITYEMVDILNVYQQR